MLRAGLIARFPLDHRQERGDQPAHASGGASKVCWSMETAKPLLAV
jgi:hypothetical protein